MEEIVVWGKVFLTKKGWLKYICPKKCLLWLLWIHFCAANFTNLLIMLFFFQIKVPKLYKKNKKSSPWCLCVCVEGACGECRIIFSGSKIGGFGLLVSELISMLNSLLRVRVFF